ncbi:MAG TPA: hypothetical protein VFZ17_11495, partial [Acidimicrobiia bacterium]|nr:hypothetical protein [Acidimicrobiia bacterium]
EAHGGHVVKTTGDGFHAAFATADEGLLAAIAAQRALDGAAWPATGPLRVRMGLHTGGASLRDGDYFGGSLNRAARLMAVAHGGQVVCSRATADLARDDLPGGVELVDLGEHRLRDLSRPERVFQVHAPGLTRTFAPLESLDAYAGNLPAQLSSFVGRERDVADLVRLLDEKRLVTLTGVGGVGKTRLALQVAAEALPAFADGSWLCELASVRDPTGVVDAAAGVFRVTARPGLGLEESLVAYLGDQELLIVLDNCEHVLRPVAALVTAIEVACPNVRVLATSREGLSVRGEQIFAVPSLDVPNDTTDLEVMSACEAVRLFVDRAQEAKAAFVIDAGNAEAVAQVCRRLDGVPLAIELAAARITTMNPRELAQRLDRRFRLLTGGDRAAIERHQTLRATIDWSYDLLTESERQLLDRVAVFADGCTLQAVEVVAAGDPIASDDVYELLANLVARSLVVVDDTAPDTRYRLLETIRQYGEERLAETGDVDAVRTRHCDHYTDFARVVQRHSYGREQIEWLARLAREHDNVIAAMAYALDTQDLERAMRLLCDLPSPNIQVDDVVFLDADPVLALPGAADHPGSSVALMFAGYQAWSRGDDPLASELCVRALAAERRLGRRAEAHVEMFVSALRASLATNAGALGEAADHDLEAARCARRDDLPVMAAWYLGGAANNLGWLDPETARSLAREGLALARQTGAPIAIAMNLVALGQALAPDDPDEARVLLDETMQHETAPAYEHPSLLASIAFAAALVAAWRTALRATSRAMHHQLRSGRAVPPLILGGIVNLAARGLAERLPEAAAVLQGAVVVVFQRVTPSIEGATTGTTAQPSTIADFMAGVRRDTTQLLIETLGEARVRELRAQGAVKTEDQALVYARTHIDEYLATLERAAV